MITVAIKLRLNRLGLNTTRVSSVSSHDYLRGLQCDGGCVTLGLRAGRERQRHRAHSSQTKMRGGRWGRGRGDYTPHKDAPFVVFRRQVPGRAHLVVAGNKEKHLVTTVFSLLQLSSLMDSTVSVNGRWWMLQVGSKEQQTNHSQRFLILFLLFFWMVHASCYSLTPSRCLTYSDVS